MRLAPVVLAAALVAVSAAVAKDFEPGDLQVCGREQCVSITDRPLLRVLSAFYWGRGRARRAQPARAGVRAFELRFGDEYVSGIVASPRLDRFRAYGFNCGRFQRGKWYRPPARAIRALRRLTSGLRPSTVERVAPRSC